MTITTAINGVTVGATATLSSNFTKVTLQALTSVVGVQMALTVGACSDKSRVRLWFTTCADNLTADVLIVAKFARAADYLDVVPDAPGTVLYSLSYPDVVRGGFLYMWIEEPKLGASATLTVKTIER